MCGNFLGYFEKHHFQVKTAVNSSWATLWKFGQHFILTSGHTDPDAHFMTWANQVLFFR